MNALEEFNAFLSSVDLGEYRRKYAHIKLVELDMPKNIQAISLLYREYWKKRKKYPSYESFYKIYCGELEKQLEEFRRKTMFSEETFHRGLPARIYRT